MKKEGVMFHQLALLAALLSCATDTPREKITAAEKPLIPADRYLVRAQCESASPWSVATRYTMRIEHVYVGDAKLKGRTFDFFVYRGQLAALGRMGIPIRTRKSDRPLHAVDFDPIEKGEVGIWWIGPNPNDGKELIAALSLPQLGNPKKERLFYCFPPALPGDKDKDEVTAYDDGLQAAQMYERVVHADAKERVALLKKYSAGPNSFAAREAIELLVRLKAPDLIPFIIRLVDEKTLDFPRKLFIEYTFWGDKEWDKSPARQKILQEFMEHDLRNVPNPAFHEERIVNHISLLVTQQHLDFLPSLKLLMRGLANPTRSRDFKDRLVQNVDWFRPKDAKLSANGLAYLLGQIADAPDLDRKRAAARLLVMFTPLPAEQTPTVEKLMNQASDFVLRRDLSQALHPPKPER